MAKYNYNDLSEALVNALYNIRICKKLETELQDLYDIMDDRIIEKYKVDFAEIKHDPMGQTISKITTFVDWLDETMKEIQAMEAKANSLAYGDGVHSSPMELDDGEIPHDEIKPEKYVPDTIPKTNPEKKSEDDGDKKTNPLLVEEHNKEGYQVLPTSSASGTNSSVSLMNEEQDLSKNKKTLVDKLSRFVSSVSPAHNNMIKNQSTGIITAAGLAAGAATGGSILYKNKLKYRFTPEDWMELGDDYHCVIEKLMNKVGFSKEEMETFKTSSFVIEASELREHIKMIQEAITVNPSWEEELIKLYNYSFLDQNKKVNEYLLFITMIIDGKKFDDKYNFYYIINQDLSNSEEANFTYSGISMENYFDQTNKEEEPNNNTPNPGLENKTEVIGKPESIYDKEWLKGIGLEE